MVSCFLSHDGRDDTDSPSMSHWRIGSMGRPHSQKWAFQWVWRGRKRVADQVGGLICLLVVAGEAESSWSIGRNGVLNVGWVEK